MLPLAHVHFIRNAVGCFIISGHWKQQELVLLSCSPPRCKTGNLLLHFPCFLMTASEQLIGNRLKENKRNHIGHGRSNKQLNTETIYKHGGNIKPQTASTRIITIFGKIHMNFLITKFRLISVGNATGGMKARYLGSTLVSRPLHSEFSCVSTHNVGEEKNCSFAKVW